ncbi:MAG: EVE domain-containing protein [Aestuariivirga sp.]
MTTPDMDLLQVQDPPGSGCWVAVASADHVGRGRREGFMQVNHGKAASLKRIRPGDLVAYYSPLAIYGGGEKLRAFTAIGKVKEGEPYQGDMGGGFKPFRRDVEWFDAEHAAIEPLLDKLDFTRGKKSWGYQFRFGLVAVSREDMRAIARAMKHPLA